jgi:dTDP-4-amino-4,6-dideoxygalactose transaminase
MIPVQRPYLGDEELEAVRKVFDTRWLGMGSTTKEFEDKLREMLGVKHVIAVNTGTSALHIAMDALDLKAGDEVIVPSLTFAAALQAVLAVGARPVFCDVHADTLNLDVADALRRVTPRTRVIMPVHYGGLACEMDELLAFARDRKIWLVEDAAHAFGSDYKGRKIGSVGDVTCFSFDPIKNITCGEGGAVTTNNDEIASRIIPKRILGIDNDTWSRYRNERNWFYEVVTPGYRYHMSNINAAIGLEQLKRFDKFKTRKQAIVEIYDQSLAGVAGLALIQHNLSETFPFFYIVRVLNGRRDQLMQHLKEKGIGTGVHYIPNHIQPLFAEFRTSLPVTEQLYEEIMTLPLYYELTDAEVQSVIEAVSAFMGRGK